MMNLAFKRKGEDTNDNVAPLKTVTFSDVVQELVYVLLKLLALAILLVIIFSFVFGLMRFSGSEMMPMVKDGDLVMFYRFDKNYVADDIAVYKYEDTLSARRVVGVPGDEIDLKDGYVYVNGYPQLQKYGNGNNTRQYDSPVRFPLVLGENEIFLLSDSRENGTDSRVYGPVNEEATAGKVISIFRRRDF